MPNDQEIQTAIQLFQSGNINQSKEILEKYIAMQPDDVNANLLSAAISASESDYLAVVEKCRKVLAIEPGNMRANYNASVASDKLKKYQDLLGFSLQTLQFDSANVMAINHQVKALYNLGKVNECIKLLESMPQENFINSPDLSIKLAECYMSISENEKAIMLFNKNILANIKPALCFHNIGLIEDRRGNFDEAIKAYQSTISLEPDSFNSNFNLAFLMNKKGDKLQALKIINRCFEIQDSAKVRQAYVELLVGASIDQLGLSEERFISDVIGDETTNAQGLSSIVMALLIHRYPVVNKLYLLALEGNYTGFSAFLIEHIKQLSDISLLCDFYINLPVTDYTFEYFSKMLRRSLLMECYADKNIADGDNDLYAAIAIRCYIDGYVYTTDEDEFTMVKKLVEDMVSSKVVPDQKILSVVSMYISLYELSKKYEIDVNVSSDDVLFQQLVKLQLDDNLNEEKLGESIESPVVIKDETSLTVQGQYECNPYPVWQTLNHREPEPVRDIIARVADFSSNNVPVIENPDILIAGSGTGSHVLQTAMRIKNKSLTAIDLSKRSLAFAKRKALEYGYANIDFLQLDILQVSCLKRKFDLIESVGVLHHMSEPLAGFKSLVDVLNPGGLMNIGLYSKAGRRYIIKGKSIYDDPDRYVTDDEIRQSRIEIMNSDDEKLAKNLSISKEFYALHECRDLIFHENEYNYNIPELSRLIDDAGMVFIGFELHDTAVLSSFKSMFPDINSYSDLNNWEIFEQKYPDTFASMYVFWCRKKN